MTVNIKSFNPKYIIGLGILLVAQNVTAQVTINSNDFPSGSDTCLISTSNQLTIVDFATTGPDQTWDFSFLEASSQRIDTFNNVDNSSALYQLSFNNWLTSPAYNSDYYNKLINNNLPAIPGGTITLENPVFFTKKSTSKLEIVGIGVEVNGIEVPVKSDTIDIVYELPMDYNDAWLSRSYFNMDMNPAYDAQFKRHQQRDAVVDGWGQITTPFGTFNALRVKTTLTYQDSIFADPFGLGGSWFALPTPETVEYNWWTNDNKVPVLKIITQAGVPTTMEYRDHEVTDFASLTNAEPTQINLYPNPTSSQLTVELPNSVNSTLEIVDLNGRTIYSNTISKTKTLNVSNWSKGLYFVRITGNNTIIRQSFIVD